MIKGDTVSSNFDVYEVPTYRAKFAFGGQGEMPIKKDDDDIELIAKYDNGWWLVRLNGVEGWAPNNYLRWARDLRALRRLIF